MYKYSENRAFRELISYIFVVVEFILLKKKKVIYYIDKKNSN